MTVGLFLDANKNSECMREFISVKNLSLYALSRAADRDFLATPVHIRPYGLEATGTKALKDHWHVIADRIRSLDMDARGRQPVCPKQNR